MDHYRQPLVSVIIPTNRENDARACAEAAGVAFSAVPHEVLVIEDRGEGVSEARNRGLIKARGRHFLLLDDDCILASTDVADQILSLSLEGSRLHGGKYKLAKPASYWAKVYALVNELWLERGLNGKKQFHLLGGFMFGSSDIKSRVQFSTELSWGGEEKELLLRLSEQNIYGRLHQDLYVIHHDQSGFSKFVKRAFFQGTAAGEYGLQSHPPQKRNVSIPGLLVPGLLLFYVFSRTGILFGKVKSTLGSKVKTAESSPSP